MLELWMDRLSFGFFFFFIAPPYLSDVVHTLPLPVRSLYCLILSLSLSLACSSANLKASKKSTSYLGGKKTINKL